MRRMVLGLAIGICAAASAWSAEKYSIQDKGGFGTTGRFIEFPDRYGWTAYEVAFRFELDRLHRQILEGSTLDVAIQKKDGGRWQYRCRMDADQGRDRKGMWANVNLLLGQTVSVLTECKIPPKKFAKSVGLDSDLVGQPTLVFHALIEDGKARAGQQKGFYFLSAGQIQASLMSQYVIHEPDPSNLGVLFMSSAQSAQLSADRYSSGASR